jgi:hypothetical protein
MDHEESNALAEPAVTGVKVCMDSYARVIVVYNVHASLLFYGA